MNIQNQTRVCSFFSFSFFKQLCMNALPKAMAVIHWFPRFHKEVWFLHYQNCINVNIEINSKYSQMLHLCSCALCFSERRRYTVFISVCIYTSSLSTMPRIWRKHWMGIFVLLSQSWWYSINNRKIMDAKQMSYQLAVFGSNFSSCVAFQF